MGVSIPGNRAVPCVCKFWVARPEYMHSMTGTCTRLLDFCGDIWGGDICDPLAQLFPGPEVSGGAVPTSLAGGTRGAHTSGEEAVGGQKQLG